MPFCVTRVRKAASYLVERFLNFSVEMDYALLYHTMFYMLLKNKKKSSLLGTESMIRERWKTQGETVRDQPELAFGLSICEG